MTDPVVAMRAGGLDLDKLGHAVLMLPLVALQLGHVSLEQTDIYLHPIAPEDQFVDDVLKLKAGRRHGRGMSTEEFCEKWFDGEDGALTLLKRITSAHVSAHEGPDATE